MTYLTATAQPTFNVFLQIDMLPTSFREVHGTRPRRFTSHADTCAYLDRTATAVLESADCAAQLAETVLAAGDVNEARQFIEQGTTYMRVYQAILDLRVDVAVAS